MVQTTAISPAGRKRIFMSAFSEGTKAILISAGWHSGRDERARAKEWAATLVSQGLHEVPRCVEDVFAEFGGLTIGQAGPGEDALRLRLTIDPTHAIQWQGSLARIEAISTAVGARTYPLGWLEDEDPGLYMASDQRVYLVLEPHAWLVGRSFEEALENMLQGRREIEKVRFANFPP